MPHPLFPLKTGEVGTRWEINYSNGRTSSVSTMQYANFLASSNRALLPCFNFVVDMKKCYCKGKGYVISLFLVKFSQFPNCSYQFEVWKTEN